ncbi:peptidase M24, structural domain-containing protein [Aspergillus caelatus]|uniref:Peptidase M24, structural domain-containing protein n=1 Tax=Aspergillus caelatus TaxID=61420 RepID=A0A5N7AHB2_9EURO|nr:peptidase M24, structural domain-containing protein [Aspergillus caelatus]KAE8368040.1 peptidase M24, structural domain-containing protein [Aspergillus caelatus]
MKRKVETLAVANPGSVRVVETARECLDKTTENAMPGMLFRDHGNIVQKQAKLKSYSALRSFCGHDINAVCHSLPHNPHYADNKAGGTVKEGMCFTIERIVALGTYRETT